MCMCSRVCLRSVHLLELKHPFLKVEIVCFSFQLLVWLHTVQFGSLSRFLALSRQSLFQPWHINHNACNRIRCWANHVREPKAKKYRQYDCGEKKPFALEWNGMAWNKCDSLNRMNLNEFHGNRSFSQNNWLMFAFHTSIHMNVWKKGKGAKWIIILNYYIFPRKSKQEKT